MKKIVIVSLAGLLTLSLIGCGEKLPKGEYDMEQGVLIMPDVDEIGEDNLEE